MKRKRKENVFHYIKKTVKKRAMHFSLLDPDPKKNGVEKLASLAGTLNRMRTDAILIGGSTGIEAPFLDACTRAIKEQFTKPVILFPGGKSGVTQHADAVFFMSLFNSKNPYWITGIQAQAIHQLRQLRLERIPMAYLVVEPGMRAGRVGKARCIKRDEATVAAGYAEAAEQFGFSLVYLEAGSGAPHHVTPEMVSAVKERIKIPLIVGGGIRTPDAAREIVNAGADIIVTGAIIEQDPSRVGDIVRAIQACRR